MFVLVFGIGYCRRICPSYGRSTHVTFVHYKFSLRSNQFLFYLNCFWTLFHYYLCTHGFDWCMVHCMDSLPLLIIIFHNKRYGFLCVNWMVWLKIDCNSFGFYSFWLNSIMCFEHYYSMSIFFRESRVCSLSKPNENLKERIA